MCEDEDRLSTVVAFDLSNTCVLQGHLVKPDSSPSHPQFDLEYGRINVVKKNDGKGGYACLPWATIVFNVATAPGERPTRIELRPDGALYWISDAAPSGKPESPPPFISLSGLTYVPRAPWTYGTTIDECLPVSRPLSPESSRQSHVKTCLTQTQLTVKLNDGTEQIIQARCRLYKRLICQNGGRGGPAGTSCLQQKEGTCKDARILPSTSWSPAECENLRLQGITICANILSTL